MLVLYRVTITITNITSTVTSESENKAVKAKSVTLQARGAQRVPGS